MRPEELQFALKRRSEKEVPVVASENVVLENMPVAAVAEEEPVLFVEMHPKCLVVSPWAPAGAGRWIREFCTPSWKYPGRDKCCSRLVVRGVFDETGRHAFVCGFEEGINSFWLSKNSFGGETGFDYAQKHPTLRIAQDEADRRAGIRWARMPDDVREND